ncbi:hypothetical protein B566_EDAN016335 [Ephemera danica]|nr:hypothetical protein B566_EDAN016335 [Ephemera danica]
MEFDNLTHHGSQTPSDPDDSPMEFAKGNSNQASESEVDTTSQSIGHISHQTNSEVVGNQLSVVSMENLSSKPIKSVKRKGSSKFLNKPYTTKDLIQPKPSEVKRSKSLQRNDERSSCILDPFELTSKKHVFKDLTSCEKQQELRFELGKPRSPSVVSKFVKGNSKFYVTKDLTKKQPLSEESSTEVGLKVIFKFSKPSSHSTETNASPVNSDNFAPHPFDIEPSVPLSIEEKQGMRRLEKEAVSCCIRIREALSSKERVENIDLTEITERLRQLECMELPRMILLKEPLVVQTICQLAANPSLRMESSNTAVPKDQTNIDDLDKQAASTLSHIQDKIFHCGFNTQSEFLHAYKNAVMALTKSDDIWEKYLFDYFGLIGVDEDVETYKPYPSEDNIEIPPHLIPDAYETWWVNTWMKSKDY